MYKKFLKRLFDILISILFLIPLSIIFIIVSVAIFIEDRGPIIYSGERLGKNGKVFKMYKFRSMVINAEELKAELESQNEMSGPMFKMKDDPRITKIGKFIRKTSIDELPQIINVLLGDMSIIGPRASLSNSLSVYSSDELDKLKVRPGITGYSQAYFRNSLSSREKRLKDAWYANNVSLWLDIKILFKTFSTVLLRKGLYTNDN